MRSFPGLSRAVSSFPLVNQHPGSLCPLCQQGQRGHQVIAAARRKHAAAPPSPDDSTSQASHRHFEDSLEWDKFVADQTGQAPPPPSVASPSQPDLLHEQELGAELEQQNVSEAQQRGRRRTRKLLGNTAAAALKDREAQAPPSVSAAAPGSRSSQPKQAAAGRPAAFVREDFWNDRSKPPAQPASRQVQRSARNVQASKEVPEASNEDAQQWWSELEQV